MTNRISATHQKPTKPDDIQGSGAPAARNALTVTHADGTPIEKTEGGA